jgi:NAD(P) transhydrogenase
MGGRSDKRKRASGPARSVPAYDLVCLGSGPAGQRAAIQAAKLDKRVAVVERRHVVGGVCVETGTIPSKTFREVVRSFHLRWQTEGDSRAAFLRHLRPRPRMDDLARKVAEVVQSEIDVVQAQLDRNGIDLFQGHARFESPHTVAVESEAGTRRLEARHVLIAVGSEPARPDGGIEPPVVVTSDELLAIPELPRTAAVVGGGVVGVEYASMFAALGIKVTLVDRRPRLLEFLDREIVDELVHQLRAHGITFRLEEAVAGLRVVQDGQPRGVLRLESGKHVVADLVLYSVGRQGATSGLGLEAAGLQADARGRIAADEHFQTAVPHVYAAGDVTGYPALAATSGEQGRRAACHMFGAEVEPMGDRFPIGIYAIPELSAVGATEEQLTRDRIPYETGVARYREIARGQILGDDSGFLKLLFHRETRALLGVHAIGTGATELIHVGQAVFSLGGGLDYFLTTVFNYPTLAECYKVAAYDAANKLQAAERVEKER